MSVHLQKMPKSGRVMRRPQHQFQLRQEAWQIQPFLIAPVLPGETMKNLLLQARVVTDPIKNPLIGWWCEYYIFYVKHRDLAERDLLTAMVLDPSTDLSSLDSPTAVANYHLNGTELAIDWVKLCKTRIVEEYFRGEGETELEGAINGLASANVNVNNYLDSATNSDDFVDPSSLDTDMTDVGGLGGAKVLASEVDLVMRQYEFARMHKLTDMTYEEYLGTYGVGSKPEEIHKPELIRIRS